MKVNVPLLGQRDYRWKNQRLGTVDGTTIGGYGCLITCMTMLAQYYKKDIWPNQMDDWLTANKDYVQGNIYRYDAFGREFPDCSFDKIVSCTNIPAPLDQIDEYLKLNKPVVVMVDFDHDQNDGIQTHFVLVTGKVEGGADDGKYIINDPWYGDEVFIDARYGEASKAINQINFFSGPVTVKVEEIVKIEDKIEKNPQKEEIKMEKTENTKTAPEEIIEPIKPQDEPGLEVATSVEAPKTADVSGADVRVNLIQDFLNYCRLALLTMGKMLGIIKK